MEYAFFQGCNIPIRIEQYARATEAVLQLFDVKLRVMDEFNCCGYPMRNVDEKAYLLPSARNIALAEEAGLDIMVICNCCFQSLKKTQNMLNNSESLTNEINEILASENLNYSGKVTIKHYLAVLHTDIGIETIQAKLHYKFKDLSSGVLHGCHLLRPREITGFDNSFVPLITEELMKVAGAQSVDWAGKMECCGAALAGINDDVANMLLKEKIVGAQESGADFITPICSYCHLQLDTTQLQIQKSHDTGDTLPVLLYPQLLGLCLGLSPQKLGIQENSTITEDHVNTLQSLLGPPVEEKKKRRRKKVAA